ncbi:MAG: YidC/Oxa1 family insertase periplasmic-domain containing protein [Candidatus Riflebacteria bacterium]|nr:YidC/Oxa1 family insertase periplasmic-domain containing protein [Candidatus Riflebacteria bacterium]
MLTGFRFSRSFELFINTCCNRRIVSFIAVFFIFLGIIDSVNAQQPIERKVLKVNRAEVELGDKDGDALADFYLETPRARVLMSGKTGEIALYYLKGKNFEENLYPPVVLDYGFKIASSGMAPFSMFLNGGKVLAESPLKNQESYIFKLEDTVPGKISVSVYPSNPSKDITFLKKYTFSDNSYSFESEVVITNNLGREIIIGGEEFGALTCKFGPGIFLDPIVKPTFVALKPAEVITFDTVEALLKDTQVNAYSGVGLKTNYFAALIDANSAVKISVEPVSITGADGKTSTPKGEIIQGDLISATVPQFSLKSNGMRSFRFNFYFGPKMLDDLVVINREKVTDYGFLSTVLLRILQFFNALIPNYGLSIILLTLVVRAILYPLTVKQTKSMVQMQKIQPMVQDLKDRYRDDTQKFNEEVLKLYQKHNVNPLGGCLPMLLQLPVLIALYNTINIAVELRKSSFLWMADLSKADPLLLLPISIAALMYYQQTLTPNVDPQQQQMMSFMPMFMFVVTWYLPSGLLVYWFTSSVIGLFQQIQSNKLLATNKEEKAIK